MKKVPGNFSSLWKTVVDAVRGHGPEDLINIDDAIADLESAATRRAASVENAGRELNRLRGMAREAEMVASGVLRRMEGHMSR